MDSDENKSPEDVKDKPEEDNNNSEFNYSNKDESRSKLSNISQKIKKNRKLLIGAGIGGAGLIGLIIAAIMALIPLKIETIVKDLEQHFFSSGNSAVSSETDTILKDYLKKYIGPAMKKGSCSKEGKLIIDMNCRNFKIVGNGNNPVVNLYKAYKQDKIENYLADHGFELKYDPAGLGTYYLKTPDMTGKGADITNRSTADHSISIEGFDKAENNSEVRKAAFATIEEDSTLWQKVMLRFKIGKLLEEKYGIKRCLVFCGVKDFFSGGKSKVKNAIYASKIFLLDRVIFPHNSAAATIAKCIILNEGCTNKASTTSCAETQSSCEETSGAQEDIAASDIENDLAASSEGFLSENLDNILSEIGSIKDKGINQYLFDKLFKALFNKESSSEVPGVGEIQTAGMISSLIQGLQNAPKTIKRLTYLATSAEAVSLFTNYMTFADEIHTGNVNSQEVGSFVNSLSSGNQCVSSLEGKCNPSNQLGGTASAEQTPLYSSLIDNSSNPGGSSTYTCRNGKPVPSGSLVCPGENLAGSNNTINAISNNINQSGLGSIADVFNNTIGRLVNGFNGIIGGISGPVLSVLGRLPPVKAVISTISSHISSIAESLFNYLIPSPIGADMSGGRTFDMMAAGADVSGNSFAHNGIGGQMLSSQQVATIQNNQNKLAEAQFAQEPLLYRLFSTSNSYSLISRFAMNIPITSLKSTYIDLVNFITNPISGMIGNIGSILDGKINANPPVQNDPFGVVQYGYTQSDLNAIGDPETYWNNNCNNNPSDGYQNGNTYNTEASNTISGDPNGSFINQTTNPCELIMATVGSDGATFNSSLLTKDEQTLVNGNSSSTSSTSTTPSSYQNPFRGIVNLVPERIDQGVDFSGTGPIYAIGDGTVNGVYPNWFGTEPLVAYTLSDGPAQGKTVYVAECITPNVQANQIVTSNTVIAQMTNCGNGIETGWANSSNLPDSMARYCWDGHSSSFGVNFSQFLQSIGGPAGVSQESNPPCTLPQGWPTW